MHLPAELVAEWIRLLAAGALALALAMALYRARWAALIVEPRRMHLVAGGAVLCLALWLLNIHLVDGMILHFLGVTTLTLLVGWSFTVLAGTAALLGFFSLQSMDWVVFPLSACLTVILPATITRLLARLLYRPTLRHPFIYILGAGFAGGALVVLLLSLLAVLLLWLSGVQTYVTSALEWSPLLVLIMFSEGFINGMCISALAVFAPDWLKTFDDRFYLDDA